jgi:non-specific serine/threonine protein kinase
MAGTEQRAPSDTLQGRAALPPRSNLLLPRSPLIGRDHEVAAIQQLLLQEEVGLLTLTGPGGIGKTRLAMQVAAQLLDHFVDGVHFVSLAPIRDAELVGVAIAQVLGVPEVGGQPLQETLQAYLQDRQLLLVLDNFEQVVAAAPLVGTLLAGCRRLKVLVTSRATLHLYGEQEYPVPPLGLPDAKRLTSMRDDLLPSLAQVAAVALFVRRGQEVKPDFTLNASNAAAVAKICVGLDGLPLALELAAASLKLFSPPALLARLQQRLTLLTGGAYDLPARQRTLRDEIGWSYELLSADEQRLFRRLAVFAGGFTLAAAQAICNAAGELGTDVLVGITALVDQNLLKPLEPASYGEQTQPRFSLLETIREYALEQLAASDETDTLRREHARFFLALAEEIAPALVGANQGAALARLAPEHDNLRAALAWSQAQADGAEIALRLAGALGDFWLLSGYWSEGRRWAEGALAMTTAEDRTEARALVLATVGGLAVIQGDHGPGQARLEEALAIARQLDAKRLISVSLEFLSWIAQAQQDHALASARLNEALKASRAIGDKYKIGSILVHLGTSARDEHDYTRAQALYEEGLAHFQALGADWDAADARCYLGQVAQARGDDARAGELFHDSLARWRAIGTLQWKGIADCLEGLAGICTLQQQFEEAARLFGAAAALRELLQGSPSPLARTSAEDKHAGLRAHLDEAAFAAAWAAGRALSTEEAVDFALALPAISASTSSPVGPGAVSPPPVTYPAGLTAREVEVLRLLAQGLTYEQIAEQLIISPRTVNRHLTVIYTKLNVTSRHAATRFALDHQLV